MKIKYWSDRIISNYTNGFILFTLGNVVFITTVNPVNKTFAIKRMYFFTIFINLVHATFFTTCELLAGFLFYMEPDHVFLYQ